MHTRGCPQSPAGSASRVHPPCAFPAPLARVRGRRQAPDWLMRVIVAVACIAPPRGPAAFADPAPRGETETARHDAWAFKLTPSYYVTERQKDATDLNLRANLGAHALWLAHYRRGNEFAQSRTGYEYTAQFPFGQIVPSLQLASHGFAGGSLNAQVGDTVYGLIGFGRTNLRDYYNLNFDPNDSLTAGFGTRLLPRSNLTLFSVWDNRLHTGQKVTHLVWRYAVAERRRLTVDLSRKQGRASADADPVSGTALSITFDYNDMFFRLARDRKVNFSDDDQTRISLGLRF